jgi:hypothetical protein
MRLIEGTGQVVAAPLVDPHQCVGDAKCTIDCVYREEKTHRQQDADGTEWLFPWRKEREEMFLTIVTTMVAIVSFSASLAHALEYPGKMTLSRDIYFEVQKIYYPGFTVAGLSEPIAIILSFILAYDYRHSNLFPLFAAAFALLILSHAVYWLLTHRVNGFWLADEHLGQAGKRFFAIKRRRSNAEPEAWQSLRNRLEWSHIIRAVFGGAAIVILLFAMAI